jgi:anti-sigma regulatory factor (Ser/Thr protein kinase)
VLAIDEIVANAVVHGGGRGELRLAADNGRLRCEVRDRGGGFRPDPYLAERQYCLVKSTPGPPARSSR